MAYIYEPEGYKIAGTYYLPDFYLPQLGCYAEVKPTLLSPKEFALAMGLGDTLLLDGVPEVRLYSCGHPCFECEESGQVSAYACYTQGHDDWRVVLSQSLSKQRLWFSFGEGLEGYDLDEFYDAVETARSARFEHGETPVVCRVSPSYP